MGYKHVEAMMSIALYKIEASFNQVRHSQMLDQDEDTNMLSVPSFTIITGGALGVDLEAEKLARDHGLAVQVIIPACHPRSQYLQPLTSQELAEAIPATKQAAFRLDKQLKNPISLQYIHRNYHVVKNADMVLAFTQFQPEISTCSMAVLATLVARTAIVGVKNIYDFPDGLLELQETFKRSLIKSVSSKLSRNCLKHFHLV